MIERDESNLERIYQTGRADMKKDLEKLKAYLDSESQTETKFDLYPFSYVMIVDIITTERGIFNGRKTSEYKTQTYKPGRACPCGCRGKTTLSEGLLFKCGRIRKIGRVDHKDAYLDTYELEREKRY